MNDKIKLIDEKLTELKKTIETTKRNDVISKNTRSTKLYALGRERRVLHLVRALVEKNDIKLSAEDNDTFILLTTLASERTVQPSIEINEHDKILEVLQKYSDRKATSIMKAAERRGLKADYVTGTFIAASPEA